MKKHLFMSWVFCAMLHVVACGQEKKQNQVHDPVKGLTEGITYNNDKPYKWSDNQNKYTQKCTKNFRFQLNDSTLTSKSEVNGIIFLDNMGKKVNFREIKSKNLPAIAKKIGIEINQKPFESDCHTDVYDLNAFDKRNLSTMLSKIKPDKRSYINKLIPQTMEVGEPTVFTNNNYLIYCTEVSLIYTEEERIPIGGMTLIQIFDIDGNEVFNFLDTNLSNKRLEVSDDFSYLIQIFGYSSIEGGTDSNPGVKIYDIKNKIQKVSYDLNVSSETSYDVYLNIFDNTNTVITLPMSDDNLKVIYIDNSTGLAKQKKYTYSEELEKAAIKIDGKNIVFYDMLENKATQTIKKDLLNSFNNLNNE